MCSVIFAACLFVEVDQFLVRPIIPASHWRFLPRRLEGTTAGRLFAIPNPAGPLGKKVIAPNAGPGPLHRRLEVRLAGPILPGHFRGHNVSMILKLDLLPEKIEITVPS